MQPFTQMILQCSPRNGRKLHSVTELMFALGIRVFLSATLHQFTINLGLKIREVGFGGQIWMVLQRALLKEYWSWLDGMLLTSLVTFHLQTCCTERLIIKQTNPL